MQIGPMVWLDVDAVVVPQDGPPPRAALVDRLAASFADFGQLSPILVRTDGRLVFGRHRHAAARQSARQVLARRVEGTDEELDALAVDENRQRETAFGDLQKCLDTYAMEVWFAERGERATSGRSRGVTTAGLGVRLGQSRTTTQRQLHERCAPSRRSCRRSDLRGVAVDGTRPRSAEPRGELRTVTRLDDTARM